VLGLAAPFLVNAVSYVGIIAVLLWWRPAVPRSDDIPPEHIVGAIRAGLHYAINSDALRATLARAAAYFVFASAFWAMLPLIARDILGGGPTLYGVLLTSVGAGAVGGALVLPRVKGALGPDRTVMAGTLGTASVLAILALVPQTWAAIGAAALAGFSWIAVLSSLNVSAQTALPDWVRARGLSVFLTVFFGAMAGGSLVWGQVASLWSIPTALVAAACGAVLLVPLTARFRLGRGESDLTPSMHWPEPVMAESTAADGPVLIKIEYRVAAAERLNFIALMRQLAGGRRRHGGYGWTLRQDAGDRECFFETWHEASWLEHRRHHRRVTADDHRLQNEIADLQASDD